jgi:hypothetical protein
MPDILACEQQQSTWLTGGSTIRDRLYQDMTSSGAGEMVALAHTKNSPGFG